jgi:hypothetical protein
MSAYDKIHATRPAPVVTVPAPTRTELETAIAIRVAGAVLQELDRLGLVRNDVVCRKFQPSFGLTEFLDSGDRQPQELRFLANGLFGQQHLVLTGVGQALFVLIFTIDVRTRWTGVQDLPVTARLHRIDDWWRDGTMHTTPVRDLAELAA